MKTTYGWAGASWMLLAIQFTVIQLACGQDQMDNREHLIAPLPELLKSEDGTSIESSAQWEEVRRKEILELFRDDVYGRVPESVATVSYRVVFEDREAIQGRAVEKEVTMEVRNGKDTLDISLLIFLPGNRPGPVPLFLGLNFNGNHTVYPDPQISLTKSWVMNNRELGITDNRTSPETRGSAAGRWPVEEILSRGYGLATIYYGDIDPDFDDGFRNGIQGIMDPESPGRDSSSWGSIAAWAWGLSRAMDYFELDPEIDQYRVAVMGHSRLGKTSLWAGALDQRFALVISNDSGCGGADLSRRPFGERVTNINTSFPHWFASKFHEYNDNEGALPVDQHMLLALVAPRPLYVASASEDNWADQYGEYLSLFYAADAYRLYNKNISLDHEMPEVDSPVTSGQLGYHMRTGEHNVKLYDWEQYLDFADTHLQPVHAAMDSNPVNREWIEARLFATHPRLILTPELEYKVWQKLDEGDSLAIMGMELVRRRADSILNLEPLERQLTGRRLLGVSRDAINRLTTLSMAYRFQRDPGYLQRLEEELKAVCSFTDWNPSHFLDVAEMAAGVALAVDWAGEWLSPAVDQMARTALVNLALKPAVDKAVDNWWTTTDNNWNLVCHGGLSLAALEVYEDAPDLATRVLQEAVQHIPLALEPYAPEGIYPEGASYWFYATTYLTACISAYESALGTDFGFTRAPGVMESAVFSQAMAGPSGDYFNYFDSGLEGFHSLTHFGLLGWFARRSGNGFDWDAYGSLLRNEMERMQQIRSTRFFPLHLLNLVHLSDNSSGKFEWPVAWSGGGREPVIIMRDRHNGPDSYFLAAKGGRAGDNHGNMDAGSFVFELDGVRWSVDPGNQDYNTLEQIMGMDLWDNSQDSPRWSVLTKNSGGHSTLVVNGEMHLVDARAPLVRRDLRGSVPQFTFDLTGLYGTNTGMARRTFSRPAGNKLRISDELHFSPGTKSLNWQMMTRADIVVKGELVELKQDGASLYLRIPQTVPYEVKVVSLSPPPLSYDKDIDGLKRLEIRWKREDFKSDSAILDMVLEPTPL